MFMPTRIDEPDARPPLRFGPSPKNPTGEPSGRMQSACWAITDGSSPGLRFPRTISPTMELLNGIFAIPWPPPRPARVLLLLHDGRADQMSHPPRTELSVSETAPGASAR